MTRSAARRLVLLPAGSRRPAAPASPAEAALRRYRLARVRVEEPAPAAARRDPARFSHLKRAYD